MRVRCIEQWRMFWMPSVWRVSKGLACSLRAARRSVSGRALQFCLKISRRSLLCGSFAAYLEKAGAGPDDADPLTALHAGRFQDALEFANRALDRNSEDVTARIARTLIYDINFHTNLAEADYLKALATERERPRILSTLPQLSFAENHRNLLDEYLALSSAKSSRENKRARGLRLWLDRAEDGRLCSSAPTAASSARVHVTKLSAHSLGIPAIDVSVNGNSP